MGRMKDKVRIDQMSAIRLSVIMAIGLSTLAGPPVQGSTGTDSLPHILNVLTEETVRNAVQEYVNARVESERADDIAEQERVEVRPRWQGDILFDEVAAGPFDLKVAPLSDKPFRGPTLVRVEISQGHTMLRALTVTVDTRFYRPVVVTSRTVRRGGQLTPDMVELAERDITSLKHGYFTAYEELAQLQVSRPIGAGDIVSRSHVKPIPLVHRGDEIVMSVVSRYMQLATFGLALQDGAEGERIRVKNKESGKILYGFVNEDGSVRIGL